LEELKNFIRDVPDFPTKGILFRDITPLLGSPDIFRKTIDILCEPYVESTIDVVVGIESRGFIFGAAMAYKLGAAFVPIRKPGKLPCEVEREEYSLEYGTDAIEIHKDAFRKGAKVLMVDDLLATGGTMSSACKLVERLGGEIVEVVFLIELTDLKGRDKLRDYRVRTVISY